MLLIYTQKLTPRISYVFKHICTRLLGVEVRFAHVIEEFISHDGPKISYGKQPMGNEFFIQSHGLLSQQGIEAEEILVKDWEETKCFFSTSVKSSLPFDIFSAAFYLLSRYEEYLPHVKDERGRYPASESLGYQNHFLDQPVIDIWAQKFKKTLQIAFPEMLFMEKNFSIHTLVQVKAAYAYKQKGFFRTVVGYINDLVKFRLRRLLRRTLVLLGIKKDPNDIFKWLVEVAKNNTSQLTVFFLLGDSPIFSEGINTRRQKFISLIKLVADYKEVGLVLSLEAQKNYELLKSEIQRLETITNRDVASAMNYDFHVQLPVIYRNLVEVEVSRDYTMLYENIHGFRAGTCSPFLFYDLDYEIKTPLVMNPVALSTSTMEGKKDKEIVAIVSEMMASVENVHGVFSMLFFNTDLSITFKNRIWRKLFSEKLQ